MAYEEKIYERDGDNEWAFSEKEGKDVFIKDTVNGKKGYRCLGKDCGNQLISVNKRTNPNHKSYFKHVAVDVKKGEIKCTFSNREYREALASSILTRIKTIKVPPLFIFNPTNNGESKLLENSKFINAFRVQSQVTFYEDDDGNIHRGKNPQVDKRYLIRRPDVVFFNEEDLPILFIELVITHKITDDKKADLHRLGIDTIQVIVPKTSPEDIEKNFYSTKNIKWVYNEKATSTNYFQVPSGNHQGVLEPDEHQRGLFKESYRCRISRVSNLIRTIKLCLESESFRNSEQSFDSELSRVKGNTKREKQELERLDESNRTRALDRNRESERKFKDSYGNLESRYNTKRKELEDAVETYYYEEGITESIKYQIENFESAIKRIEEETREFDKLIESEENRMEEEVWREFVRETELIVGRIEEIRVENEIIEDKIRTSIDAQIKSTEKSIGNIGIRQKRIDDTIRRDFRTKIEFEESEIERFEREERELETTVRDEFHRECIEHPAKLPERIRSILETERLANNFELAKRQEARYKRAYELFRKGTWEKR